MSLNSSVSSYNVQAYYCSISNVSIFISTAINAMKSLLLLPLCTFILHLGHQQWQQQRSLTAASNSAIFTYHLAAMELIWVFGCFFFLGGLYAHQSVGITVGLFCYHITIFGEIFFHILTCGERYLAVVHPITYRGLRNARGIRIRNVSIGCVWLLSFLLTNLYCFVTFSHSAITLLCVFIFAIMVLSFCTVSVLCALIGPRPGDGGGEKKRVDQPKRRAFYTITVISCVVWFWFVGLLVGVVVDLVAAVDGSEECVMTSLGWFNVLSSLVQPLLYLQNAGKLPCYRSK